MMMVLYLLGHFWIRYLLANVSTPVQRLATDWKTYIALPAGAGMLDEAFTGLFTKFSRS
jgi:hypothetical protein